MSKKISCKQKITTFAKCNYCGHPVPFTKNGERSHICNSCLYLAGKGRVTMSNFVGGDYNYWNYNQNAIDDANKELEEIEQYKKELLLKGKRQKAAK